MGSLRKNIQLMLEFLKAPFLVLLFLLYINDFPDDVICNIAIYSYLLSTVSVSRHLICLRQKIKLASELESGLRDTVDRARKWLVDFIDGKTQLVLFDRSNNSGAIDVKISESALEEKSCFKMLRLSFSLLN